MFRPKASAAFAPKSITPRFSTGNAPGKPKHTGHVFEFGSAPKLVGQPQKIFVSVASCTCISIPITASQPSFIKLIEYFQMICCFWNYNFNQLFSHHNRNLTIREGGMSRIIHTPLFLRVDSTLLSIPPLLTCGFLIRGYAAFFTNKKREPSAPWSSYPFIELF